MYFVFVACCKTQAEALVLRKMMEVQDQNAVGRWDGLCSRDPGSRAEALETICQEVMRKVEAIDPITAPLSPASGNPPNSDLNDILVHLLMLSKRCPFEDVRDRCMQLLQDIQVRRG